MNLIDSAKISVTFFLYLFSIGCTTDSALPEDSDELADDATQVDYSMVGLWTPKINTADNNPAIQFVEITNDELIQYIYRDDPKMDVFDCFDEHRLQFKRLTQSTYNLGTGIYESNYVTEGDELAVTFIDKYDQNWDCDTTDGRNDLYTRVTNISSMDFYMCDLVRENLSVFDEEIAGTTVPLEYPTCE